ncbi:nuclear movement protein, putative [Plasmodium berghei]|uniref:Nuclear migration protein nudC n=2 Tax=Plasmodium berghei TaxID=5821 RepID=A0A509AP75_PLABA|nr:nuclear movement protein, putative [Plasmodium berghei ANKA]CXJ01682.1 nuclear movement protein, putative [Plasmodium berghei]SCL98215.1 nuclear movement protein, putative [Plasmodium berghei]SCM16779.1 nuclear movement protein, putative [Plasmodium berghei]SCM18577.1 nuclear movement protein, putative [Plasmodium berghei]SCN28010.1 nuclear movement protein, putative [Plasmodium berghei]|eukprot:XP_034423663.1 nuclear movement protein, putative [Plasmodium berghei ANKA]
MDGDIVVNEKFDFLMLSIAKECGDINNFMNIFFSFLLRKTDFITNSKNIEQCEEVVLRVLKKHYKKKDEYLVKLKKEYEKMDEEKKKILERENNINKTKNGNIKDKKKIENNNKVVEIEDDDYDKLKKNDKKNMNESGKNNKQEDQINENNKQMNSKSNNNEACSEDDDDGDCEPPKGNGGKTEKYTWTQTLGTVDMYIDVEEFIKTKDIKVDITFKKLSIKVKNNIYIEGEFHKHIKPEDSIWTLEDNRIIHISIEKLNTMEWWATVIKGDPEIDVKKIVPENSRMEDLDSETRSVVEKMLYDQKQKALNLPTSEEKKKFEIFEKFKQMHPEMDFSKANINYGNSSSGNMFFGK